MAKKIKRKESKNAVQVVTGWLEAALELSRAFERLLVDVVAAFVPWLAPLIPAYLAFDSLYNVLIEGVLWVGIVGATVVEFLGLATITTVVQFKDFNENAKPDDPKAPFWVAALTAAFYLIVVLTVNVLLDSESDGIHKTAKLLMSSLSVAGAVTISLRGQHARRVAAKAIRDATVEAEQKALETDDRAYKRQVAAERRQLKYELKKMELELKVAETQTEQLKVSEKVVETISAKPATFGKWKTWRKVPDAEKLKIVRMTVEQVVETYGVEERTAYHWLEYAKRDTGLVGEVAQFQEELRVDQFETLEV